MKKVKRVLLSLLAVTALVPVCLAPRASASMSSIFGSTGNGSTRPGSAQWQLPESSTIQQQESSQQENTQQSMSSIFGSMGNGSNRPGSAMWQQESIQQQSTQQQSTQQQESAQQQESTQQEKIYQAAKDALSNAGSEDVAYRYLKTLVTEIAAQIKQRDSATPHYEIEEKVVRFLKQSGTTVFDEMSLRKTIRQILAEAYPDAYTPDSHPDDRKRNDLLDKTLRQLVSQTLIQMNAANFSAQKETIAEGLINKIKENGFLISDEAALRQQILRLIEEMIPSDNDTGDGNHNSTGKDDDEGFEEFASGQSLFNGYTQGNSSIKNSSSNTEEETRTLRRGVPKGAALNNLGVRKIILESVLEVGNDYVEILCKLPTGSADGNITTVGDLTIKNLDDFTIVRCFAPNTIRFGEGYVILKLPVDHYNFNDHLNEEFEVSNDRSSVVFKVREKFVSLEDKYTGRLLGEDNENKFSTITDSEKLISTVRGEFRITYEVQSNCDWDVDGPLKMPNQLLVNSPGKPGALHSISYKDGKLKVSTAVEPTLRVEQIIQREGLDSNPFDAKHHEFSMPGNEVIIPDPKKESRTITVVSRGETVAVYEFLPGADLSDFDASGDLKWPAPEEHLKLAGWRWNHEGSDRWMEKPSVMPDENLVVTSLWWPEEYSVTCNGEKTWVPFGHDLYPPAVETPEGMVFDHWEWTVEGSTAVIDKPYTMPACNLIATPFWTPRAYCLTVNGAATQVLYGTALAEPAAPEAPEGHSFGGWKWTVGGAEAAKPAAMPACDVTAEPIWTRNAYTLTFIGNEDGTVLFSQSCYYGDTIPYPANPTREGQEFIGWSFNVGYTVTTMPACDVTATANWKDATPPTPEEPEAPMEYFVYYYRDDDLISQQSYPEGAQIVPPDGMWLWPENLDSKWIMPGYDLNIYSGSENPDAVS